MKKSKEELVDYLLENFVNDKGELDISNLDFQDFKGNINISGIKCEGGIKQGDHESKSYIDQARQKNLGPLFQNYQNNKGDLFSDFPEIKGQSVDYTVVDRVIYYYTDTYSLLSYNVFINTLTSQVIVADKMGTRRVTSLEKVLGEALKNLMGKLVNKAWD